MPFSRGDFPGLLDRERLTLRMVGCGNLQAWRLSRFRDSILFHFCNKPHAFAVKLILVAHTPTLRLSLVLGWVLQWYCARLRQAPLPRGKWPKDHDSTKD